MGRKIFVSYKYKDSNVQQLPGVSGFTWVRDYVDYIAEHLINDGHIYKGEDNTEDLSDKSERIASSSVEGGYSLMTQQHR